MADVTAAGRAGVLADLNRISRLLNHPSVKFGSNSETYPLSSCCADRWRRAFFHAIMKITIIEPRDLGNFADVRD